MRKPPQNTRQIVPSGGIIKSIPKGKEKLVMAHKITDECIACGGCQSVCPCDAISEGDGKYEINPDLCVDCGSCSAQCPVGAIEEE